jgi:hypothetical protein
MNGPGMGYMRAERGGARSIVLFLFLVLVLLLEIEDEDEYDSNYQRVARPPRLRSHFCSIHAPVKVRTEPPSITWSPVGVASVPSPGASRILGNFSGSEEKA